MVEYFCFSDGGCINNGKKNAKASFCSVFIDGREKNIIKDIVKPYKYYLNDENIIFDNDCIVSINSSIDEMLLIDESVKIAPSNNRGELLGIIYSLLQLLNRGLNEKVDCNTVEIYTDSLICVNTFNEWLPTRRKNNTAHELKNFDLLIIAEYLLDEIKKIYLSVNIIHVKSHQPRPNEYEGTRKLFIWLGNQAADKHCSILLNSAM
jgi:ribonuclease HI